MNIVVAAEKRAKFPEIATGDEVILRDPGALLAPAGWGAKS